MTNSTEKDIKDKNTHKNEYEMEMFESFILKEKASG